MPYYPTLYNETTNSIRLSKVIHLSEWALARIEPVNSVSNFENVTIVETNPNPFSDIVTIKFTLLKNKLVTIDVMNYLGTKLNIIANEMLSGGDYSFQFDGTNIQAGVYFINIRTGTESKVYKLIKL
ncbi:MAG: hypothetical protein A2X64_08740 [Ignavibacteria bacterium GWF2_33_9]|nr:MAG: hypothetical protein A2X64_08740 [Ignavibacteria bacterium GWF2_33_9]